MEKIVEILLKEIVASPTVTKIMLLIVTLLLFVIIILLIWGGKYFLKFVSAHYKAFRKEIRLLNYKLDSTDRAIGDHFDNGYHDSRAKYFEEYKDNDNFIND